LQGGGPDQAFGAGQVAPVPGHDPLGVGERGLGDGLVAPAERGAGLGDGGRGRGFVSGDGGQAGPGGQEGGNEHGDGGLTSGVGGLVQRAGRARGVAGGDGEAGFAERGDDLDGPYGASSSCGAAEPYFRLGRVELACGGEEPGPPVAHDRLGETVRVRGYHRRGLVQHGLGGGRDAGPGDVGSRRDREGQGEAFLPGRGPGELDGALTVPLVLGQVAGQVGGVGQQHVGPRRERPVGVFEAAGAGFEQGADLVRIARVPGQAGEQGAAPDLQLRFPGLPGAGEAVAGQPGRPRSVTEVVRGPGRPQQHPGLDAGGGGSPYAEGVVQEPAALAVAAGRDPPSGEPGGQFPSRFGLVAAERPRQRGADVRLLRRQAAGPRRPSGAGQGRIRRAGHVQRP
jgi:hypothetical protein